MKYYKLNGQYVEEMTLPIDDYKKLERLMCRYFDNVDISKEKTDMEKLALEIACIGMQTIGHLIQELEEQKNDNEKSSR